MKSSALAIWSRGMNSLGLWATAMSPGPHTTVGMPALVLIETTLVTLLVVENLAGAWDETLDLGD